MLGSSLLRPEKADNVCPYALGATVDELDLKSLPDKLNPLGDAKPKTLFSMMIPEVADGLKKHSINSVVIFGIEVS